MHNDMGQITAYGCIGERLGHSFSGEIHRMIGQALAEKGEPNAPYDYVLEEIAPENLEAFLSRRAICGINVTIPYKQSVMPYLDELTEVARQIGAVNTVVSRKGRLVGDNTDFYGLRHLLSTQGIDLKGKKVLIFGTGGTSNTAYAVAKDAGAKEILKVSRQSMEGCVTYDSLTSHTDANVIINTTPVGMYPNDEGNPLPEGVSLSMFPALCGVVDVVYHPLRTNLVLQAKELGIAATGGLAMLVAQAVAAAERFLDRSIAPEIIDRITKTIEKQKENLVLIGMPGSGKSTVGKLLSEWTGRRLIDTDEEFYKSTGVLPGAYIQANGETDFRAREAEVIRDAVAMTSGGVVATGGGAVLSDVNVRALKRNGRLIFLDRPLEALVGTSDRPLSANAEQLRRRYEERYDRYCAVADEHWHIALGESPEQTAKRAGLAEQMEG